MSKPSTRDTILDAATDVVALDGAKQLTIDAVAAKSGVSKGGVLYHFPNKVALLQGMVDRVIAEVIDDVQKARLTATEAGEPVLPRVIDALFERIDTNDSVSGGLLAASVEHRDLLGPAREAISGLFQQLANEAPDPIQAQIILLALDGLKMTSLLGISHVDPNQITAIRQRMIAMAREPYA